MEVSGQLHASAALHLGNSTGTHRTGKSADSRDGLNVEVLQERHHLPLLGLKSKGTERQLLEIQDILRFTAS
jgi:hypothetical protein